MEKTVVILADSLTNDFLNADPEFLQTKVNIGKNEIQRLVGDGKGPLISFLRGAVKARQAGKNVHLILIRDWHDADDPAQQPELLRHGFHNIKQTRGAEFVPWLQDIVPQARVINTPSLALPVRDFHRVMKKILSKDILSLNYNEQKTVIFVVAGLYTDIRVLNIASKIRNDYQFPYVYVCPHLIGSKNIEAHLTALKEDFPNQLINVITGLPEIERLCGIEIPVKHRQLYESCRILPPQIAKQFVAEQRLILENIFMFYSTVELKSLSGGFSGACLFIARGRKGNYRTESVIVKIDKHYKIQKDLDGYNLMKDFLGKSVPSIDLPVSYGEYTGIRMELASIAGQARALQSFFEKIKTKKALANFLAIYDEAFKMLNAKLYCNTRQVKPYNPYLEFGLTGERQKKWLAENIGYIIPRQDLSAAGFNLAAGVKMSNCISAFEKLLSRSFTVKSDICLCHGDLNFANLLTDDKGVIWIIDLAYAGKKPVETDFAKMENDIKFVLSKDFRVGDLKALLLLEKYLLVNIELPQVKELPPNLNFINTDLHFYKMYAAVRLLRNSYIQAGTVKDIAVYRLALLKYSLHTLSFDKRRGRGECSLVQLKYALLSTALLIELFNKE